MSKLSAILPAVATMSLLTVGGCATKDDINALRLDIAALRASLGGPGTIPTMGPPPAEYQKVTTLMGLPEFMPGLGTLYIRPQTRPAGPYLAYDRDNRLVSTVYMIPLSDMAAQKAFPHLPVANTAVREVDFYYTPGHPGLQEPHYHVVLWHVPQKDAKLR